LELVIFYEKYYEEIIIKIADTSSDEITGLLFPIISRINTNNINNIKIKDAMGLFNVIEICDEEFFGRGIYYDENGCKYNGKGILYYENRRKAYEGEFKDGKYNGKGITYRENGSKAYEGKFKDGKYNGKYNGKGITYHTTGKKAYEGEFKDGNKSMFD
jgi:hypothetical protein